MFRNLYADIRSILLSRLFGLAMIFILVGQILNLIVSKVVYYVIDADVAAEAIAYAHFSLAGFLVTAATLFITDREFIRCVRRNIAGSYIFDVCMCCIARFK